MKVTFPTIDYAIEVLKRRDMRSIFTFTIDPQTAKDFDDAISYQDLEGGLIQVGVHIADVSFFVPAGSDIDNEAYEKGNSTYLVDKVIPMLPEELSNNLCSLMPHKERLCMSIIFTMTRDAKIQKYKICRTIIHSNVRMNYNEAQQILSAPITPSSDELAIVLHRLSKLAQILRSVRLANGALNIEGEDIRFELNDAGHPVRIYLEESNEAHHLIEEFMLLANRAVATHIGNRPFIYRVHDKPDIDRLADINRFSKRPRSILDDPKAFNDAINILRIRAQAKAVYSTNNIGHYGLQFSCYTHFTSPIRRYPDLMVHRLLDQYVLRGKKESFPKSELETIAEHCSATEQNSTQAERDSIKYFMTLYMQDRLGEEFEGHIVNVTSFGVFVRLEENHCEGLIHITKLEEDDYMDFDEKRYRLVAQRKGTTFTLGDAVRVRVVRADPLKSQVDFELVRAL